MPDWGTALGGLTDFVYDRTDKEREFQLRKQQEEALNTLRQIQINAAMEEAEKQKAWKAMTTPQFQKYAEGDNLTPLGQQKLGGMMGGIQQNLEGWNPTQLQELGIQQENPEYAPALAANTQKVREQGGESVMPSMSVEKLFPFLSAEKGAELMASAPGQELERKIKLATLNNLQQGEWEDKVEDLYDPRTKTTFGRNYYYNKRTREKIYEGDWTPRKGRESTNIHVGTDSKLDYSLINSSIKELPKLHKDARQAVGKIVQYNQLTKLIDAGAGGIEGGIKAAVAPVAEYFGFDSKNLSEAQAYQLMARAGAGGMRLALIGPGQVSNYEQELIQKLSGGSIKVSRQAARDLFKYYQSESKRIIENYNESLKNLTDVYPKAGMLYKPIEIGTTKEQEPPPSGAKPRFTIKKVK